MTATALLGLFMLAQAAPERQAAEQGALAAAHDIVQAVKTTNPDAILAHVAPGGIPCVDSVVPRKKVEQGLKAQEGWYHAYFFDPVQFNKHHLNSAIPISFAEFVAKGGELSYRVRFQRFPSMPPFSSPCVSITSKEIKGKQVLCFYHQRGKWLLKDGPNCG